jgi:hypothetical protein
MRSSLVSPANQLTAGLDVLAGTDLVAMDDRVLREELLDLLAAANRVHAELARRLDVFDRRGLPERDGFRTAKAWLQAFGRLSGSAASRMVSAARLLRRLPKLAVAAQSGDVPAEQVQQIGRLAAQVGVERVVPVEATLADAARTLDPARFAMVCARVRAHLDPDGPDPAREFAQRSLVMSVSQGMVLLRGELDPEGGAAVATALDALMAPPGADDSRSPGQRRADALVELARQQLAAGHLPRVGGQRPQVGVLLHPQALSPATLARLAELHRDEAAGQRLRELAAETDPGTAPAGVDWTRPGVPIPASDQATSQFGRAGEGVQREPRAGPPGARAGGSSLPDPRAGGPGPVGPAPGWVDPPWLNWVGAIRPEVAQRIACDAQIWRVILDPASGQPLDVGRAHRLVPHWIRRALHARDRGCRWPGCTAPTEWTDAHHLDPWADGGHTNAERCLLLCRHHHSLVHEAGWSIDLHPTTGQVTITRPGGIPYRNPGTTTSWNGPTTRTT